MIEVMRIGVLALIVAMADVRPAEACATAPPAGEEVQIAEEEALIVWDPQTKVERFFRRAAFRSTARQFGFLVPTPTTPQLSEVPDWIFSELATAIRPAIEVSRERHYEAGSWLFESCLLRKAATKAAAPDTAAAPVRVIATANVAGFDATTVEADDAAALAAWLGQHGFAQTPQLTAWLERYVAEHWKLTAFVIASSGDGEAQRYEVATKAVQMTFPAERPFYPYREPQLETTVETDAKLVPSSRVLRVFFASDARYAATLAGAPWSARVLHAAPLAAPPSGDLAPVLGAQRHLTVFVDDSSPRRGIEELYFAPAPDQAVVRQSAIIVDAEPVTVPVDLILLGLGAGVLVVRRIRR